MPILYTLVRSRRKTLALLVDTEGKLTARAPQRMPVRDIEAFVAQKEPWIREKQALALKRKETVHSFRFQTPGGLVYEVGQPVTREYIRRLRQEAKALLLPRIDYWQTRLGLATRKVSFTSARTRWGSMSSKDGLRLNIALAFCPQRVADYVIVHELAHMRHMDHSSAFWQQVEAWMPDYGVQRAWLKEHSGLLALLQPAQDPE